MLLVILNYLKIIIIWVAKYLGKKKYGLGNKIGWPLSGFFSQNLTILTSQKDTYELRGYVSRVDIQQGDI